MAASLVNLSLIYWNIEVVGNIFFSFGAPLCAKRACKHWEDLTSFDVDFLCENLDSLSEVIEVTVGLHTYEVKLQIKYSCPHNPLEDLSFSQDDDHKKMDEDEVEFWFEGPNQRVDQSSSHQPRL